MRILLFGFGSRGDVQPLVALGKGLREAGYEVSVAAARDFRAWIEGEGLTYALINVDMEAAMQSEIGKNWLGGSNNSRAEMQAMKHMADTFASSVSDDILAMLPEVDVVVSGVLTMESLATAARFYGKQYLLGLTAPFAPSASGSAGMQALLPRSTSPINRWWGYVIEAFLYGVLKNVSVTMRTRLKLPPPTRADFLRAINQTPTLLSASPLIVPPPPDWGSHIRVTGYWFDAAPVDYQPPADLRAFLEAGEPPVYIGFGSMSNRDPQATTRLLLDALKQSGRRGVIHSGWAGLHAEDVPPDVLLVKHVPHDWLFPRMAGVIHHGGAGTTGAGLRAGVPSAVVAHIGDQPYWGRRIHELGVGAAPMRRHELTAERLAATIRALTGDAALSARAAAFGERIRAEDGVGNAVNAIGEVVRR